MRIRDKTRYLSTAQKTQTKCDIDFLFHLNLRKDQGRDCTICWKSLNHISQALKMPGAKSIYIILAGGSHNTPPEFGVLLYTSYLSILVHRHII